MLVEVAILGREDGAVYVLGYLRDRHGQAASERQLGELHAIGRVQRGGSAQIGQFGNPARVGLGYELIIKPVVGIRRRVGAEEAEQADPGSHQHGPHDEEGESGDKAITPLAPLRLMNRWLRVPGTHLPG